MDLIIETYGSGRMLGASADYNFDLQIGADKNDFEISIDYAEFLKFSKLGMENFFQIGETVCYVPDEEYGGIIKDIEGATNTEKIYLRGYTWRGMLQEKIIVPPSGQDYKTVSGNLETVLRGLISDAGLSDFFSVLGMIDPPTVSFTFDRYVTLLLGITKLLKKYNLKMYMYYHPGNMRIWNEDGEVHTYQEAGRVDLGCTAIRDYGSEIEISQDAKMDFSSRDYRMGVNHLICLGTGELQNRAVVDLYADASGNISQTQTFTGTDEITDTFENVNADAATLVTQGTERLKTLLNYKKFTANAKYIDDINLGIGDTITGRDLITGTVVTQPIKSKIVKLQSGIATVDYKI